MPATQHPTQEATMDHAGWTRTHCYLCGAQHTARQQELMAKLDADTLTGAEQAELERTDCPNGCWAVETAAYQAQQAR